MLGGMADALSPGSERDGHKDAVADAGRGASAGASRSPRGAEEDALAGATPAEANDAALFSGEGDAVSATATPLDLDALTRAFARTANDVTNANELCVLTSFSEKRPGGVDGPPLGESLAAHGALVEGALRRVAESARKKYIVARVALLLRLGAVPAGEPAVVVAVSAARWRDAADAAAHCSGEIKDKLAASIAPLCLGSEPKAAARSPRWRRRRRDHRVAARADHRRPGGGGHGGGDDRERPREDARVERLGRGARALGARDGDGGEGGGGGGDGGGGAEPAAPPAAPPPAAARGWRARPRSRRTARRSRPRTKRTPWTWTASRSPRVWRPPTRRPPPRRRRIAARDG